MHYGTPKNTSERGVFFVFQYYKNSRFGILHISMSTNWSIKRKLVYASAILLLIVLSLLYTFREVIFAKPTCFDGRQNGYESDVDCGGACSLRCTEEVLPLSVAWSSALPTASSTYDFVALVSNKNLDNAPKELEYIFTAYNAEGLGYFTAKGTTVVPIDGDFPIIVQKVPLTQAPAQITVQLKDNLPHYKTLEKPTEPTIRITGTRYEAGSIPRVYSTLTNTKRLVFSNLPVRVILYNANGNAYGVGETVLPTLNKEETKEIVFTWNRAFVEEPTKIRIFPILDPFLGSL